MGAWFTNPDLRAAIEARSKLVYIDTYDWDDPDAPEHLQRARGNGTREKAVKAIDRLILDLIPDMVIVGLLRRNMGDKGHGHPMLDNEAEQIPRLSSAQWAARMKPLIASGQIKVVETIGSGGGKRTSYAV